MSEDRGRLTMAPTLDDRTDAELHEMASGDRWNPYADTGDLIRQRFGRCCDLCCEWIAPGASTVDREPGYYAHQRCADEEFAETHQMEEVA